MTTYHTGPRTIALAILFCLAFLPVADLASGLSYYEIDFGTPPHQLGQPPVVGAGPPPRATISGIYFGTPMVVANFGSMIDQPCEFNSFDAEGDQIAIDLTDLPGSDFYAMACDILVADLNSSGTFTVLFDTPSVRTIRFTASGDVDAYVPGVLSDTIGSFTIGTIVHLEVRIDLLLDVWEVDLDGIGIHSGAFGDASEVNTVRFSTNVTANPPGVSAAIDNISISEEPFPIAVENGTWGKIKQSFR